MIQTTTNGHNLILIQSKDELYDIIDNNDHKSISINVETTGFDYIKDYIVGVSVGIERLDKSIDSYYIPLRHKNYGANIDTEPVFTFLQYIIDNERILFFNRVFSFFFLEKEGIKCALNKTHDVQIMLYLATSKSCPSRNEYARLFIPNVEIFDLDFSKQNFSEYNPENAYIFSAQKAVINILLGAYVWEKYEMIHNIYLLDNKSNEVVRWFCKNSEMCVDYDYIKAQYEKVNFEIENIKSQIKSIAGFEIDIDNQATLLQSLKDLRIVGSGVESMNNVYLEDYNHPIARLLYLYEKKHKPYKASLENILANDGKNLKLRYSTVTASTGRLTSGHSKDNSYFSDFNAQNVGKTEMVRYVHKGGDIGFYVDDNAEGSVKEIKCKGGLRDAFVCPSDEYVWVSCDYSGEEMCLLANFSKESNLIEPIKRGEDIHTFVARNIFGIESSECRSKTKALNFSVVYGMGNYRLAKNLGISIEECEKLLKKYYGLLRGVAIWKDKMIAKARRQGYVSTLFGRPRMLFNEYQSTNRADHNAADRAACNSPIQGCTPLNGHLETKDSAVRMKNYVGRDVVGADGRGLIVTHRGESQPLFCLFKSGDYLICDSNHQLVYNNMKKPKVTSVRNGYRDGRVILSKLQRKSFKLSRFFFKSFSDCKALFTMSCKRDDVIKKTNKDINSALLRLALSWKWFKADYDAAISMRSVASMFGYNVVYSARKDKFKVRFWRRRKSGIKSIWWCFEDDRRVPVGTCTATKGYQMYVNQGFWNKNTGADIMRIVLCKFKDLFDKDAEWAENVRFVCSVYDECNFYVKKSYLEKGCMKIYGTMYFEHPLCVLPIVGKLSVGSDWGHLADVELEQIENNTIKF